MIAKLWILSGESQRTTKKVLYKISDPTIRFWFSFYSPHRSTWHTYTSGQKKNFLIQHAGTVFEDFVRTRYFNSGRYWEKDVEFDMLFESKKKLFVCEVKFKDLNKQEQARIMYGLIQKWHKCKLSKKYKNVEFVVMDKKLLNW